MSMVDGDPLICEKVVTPGLGTMRVGFSRVRITPPLGTRMMGFAARDREHGCTGVHDDLFVRALWLEQGRESALIMGFDLCFLGRADADRVKGAIGRHLDLCPRQILLNTSHTHVGPSVGTWGYAAYDPPDRLYLEKLVTSATRSACEARQKAVRVSVRAGVGRSTIPMNRRRLDQTGRIVMSPNPGGPVYDKLPVCLFESSSGFPVCLLFSLSCHPSTIGGFEISADYPGDAMRLLDDELGGPCSLFLQGVGGDAKPSVIADMDRSRWRVGTWDDVASIGTTLAEEVKQVVESRLWTAKPTLRSACTEMHWPLQPSLLPVDYARWASSAAGGAANDLRRLWAERQVRHIECGGDLPTAVSVTLQAVQLGVGVRIVGMEGEAVSAWGKFIEAAFDGGITFPLGYTNGEGLYLVTSDMVDEGGYEVNSYYEYGWPSPLAKGMETEVSTALDTLQSEGIR